MTSAFQQDRRRNGELLFQSEAAFVMRDAAQIELNRYGPWTPELTRLATKFQINALFISEAYQREWASLDFLLDLPPLQRLHVVLSRPADLSPITKLIRLEFLGLMGDVSAEGSKVPAVDFSLLTELKSAYVELAAPTFSLLNCSTLTSLWVWNHCKPWVTKIDLSPLSRLRELHVTAWAKLTELDLSHQPDLEQLHIEAIGKLKRVDFHPAAQLRRFKLGGCGPYRIDWNRMGEDLHELELSGPLRFPIEDVLQAPNLRVLDTIAVRKFPPLEFLLKLPQLERFSYFTSPPGPKWSASDNEIIRQISARRKRSKTRSS